MEQAETFVVVPVDQVVEFQGDKFDLRSALDHELQAMRERDPKRSDVKFRVLQEFCARLQSLTFEEAYTELPVEHKHVVITRIENQSVSNFGIIPNGYVETLAESLYGTKLYSTGKMQVDRKRKAELEQLVQDQNYL